MFVAKLNSLIRSIQIQTAILIGDSSGGTDVPSLELAFLNCGPTIRTHGLLSAEGTD